MAGEQCSRRPASSRWSAWIQRIRRALDPGREPSNPHSPSHSDINMSPPSDTLTMDELLASLLDQLDDLITYDSASLLLRRPEQPRSLRLAAFRGKPERTTTASLDDLERIYPAAHSLLRDIRAIVISDTGNDPRWIPKAVSDPTRSWMGLPLVHDDHVLGVLSIASHNAGDYTQTDLERLIPYAAQAAASIDRLIINQRLQRRFDEVTALNDMARAITSMLDPDDILHYIMDQAQELFEAEAASVALIDNDEQTLTFRVAVGAGADGIVGQQLPMGQGVAGWVASTGKPARVANTRGDDRFMDDIDRQTGFITRNIMCAPMIVKDRTIGIVEIINRRISTFSEDDLHLLSAVSAQVGAAVDRSRLYRRAQQRATQMTALYDASVDLVGRTQLPDLLDTIARRAAAMLDAGGSRLYLLEDAPLHENNMSAESLLRLQASTGIGAHEATRELMIGEGAAGQAVEADEAIIVNDYSAWVQRSPAPRPTHPSAPACRSPCAGASTSSAHWRCSMPATAAPSRKKMPACWSCWDKSHRTPSATPNCSRRPRAAPKSSRSFWRPGGISHPPSTGPKSSN